MTAAKLAVISLLALLGSVSCIPGNGNGYGYGRDKPAPPPPAGYPPTSPSPVPPPEDAGKQLKVGYYKNKCGKYVDVEAVVKKHVKAANAGIQAGLIRLFFHDCFVRGCDASVLLEPTSANPQPEKLGIPNFPSLRGFEVIDAAKADLEKECPGVVSCADIVAFAGRDASYFLSNGRANFDMPAGRYDGNLSLADETLAELPPPFANVQQLKDNFAAKGLDTVDLVVLSGGHSIGRSHCSSFSDRLPPSNTSDMDPAFGAKLKEACASPTGADNTVVQDFKTPNDLDKQYYKNVLQRKVLFESDAALLKSDDTKALVKLLAKRTFESKFGEAMVKMGRIEVKTAANGEIRKACGFVNAKPF